MDTGSKIGEIDCRIFRSVSDEIASFLKTSHL